MKIHYIIPFAVVFLLSYSIAYSQSECKVTKLGIEEEYVGECKKGLANGKGKASGVDSYNGEFKKGVPHGYGEYVWANGDTFQGEWVKGLREGKGEMKIIRLNQPDSLVIGFWENDNYMGEWEFAYELVSKSPEVLTTQFSYKGEFNQLALMFTKRSNPIAVSALNVTNLYGRGVNVNRTFVFRDITYPYNGDISFSYFDGTAVKFVTIAIVLNAPGSWEIRFDLREVL